MYNSTLTGDNAALCLAQLLQSSYSFYKSASQSLSLSHHFFLDELSVSDNPDIGDRGITALLLTLSEGAITK